MYVYIFNYNINYIVGKQITNKLQTTDIATNRLNYYIMFPSKTLRCYEMKSIFIRQDDRMAH